MFGVVFIIFYLTRIQCVLTFRLRSVQGRHNWGEGEVVRPVYMYQELYVLS